MAKPKDPSKCLPVQKRCALRSTEIAALEMAALGHSQQEIAEVVGLTRSGVGKMLQRTERKLAEMLRDTGDAIKARQTHHLEVLYREAMAGWRRSQKDAEETKETTEGNGTTKRTETRRGQAGDPRFLDQANKALESIRKIWGLNAADKHDREAASITIKVEYDPTFFGGRATIIDAAAGEPEALPAPETGPTPEYAATSATEAHKPMEHSYRDDPERWGRYDES